MACQGCAYLAPLFAGLSEAAIHAGKDVDFVEMSREFATKSGLNEQLFRDFDERCGTLALTRVLDRVFERINNR